GRILARDLDPHERAEGLGVERVDLDRFPVESARVVETARRGRRVADPAVGRRARIGRAGVVEGVDLSREERRRALDQKRCRLLERRARGVPLEEARLHLAETERRADSPGELDRGVEVLGRVLEAPHAEPMLATGAEAAPALAAGRD